MSVAIKEDTGRYSIGELIVGVAVIVMNPGRNGAPSKRSATIHTTSAMQTKEYGTRDLKYLFKVFKVEEHHKVLNDYSENNEPTCDGYILSAEDSDRKWHNQYPVASYGQISDIGNSVFTMAGEDSDDVAAIVADFNNPWRFITLDHLLDGLTPTKYESERVLKDLNSSAPRMSSDFVSKIDQKRTSIINAFNEVLGDRFKIESVEVYPNYFRNKVVSKW